MAEVTPEFLGERMRWPFDELRRMDGELDQSEDEVTVPTGAFMRQDAEREGRELSAAGPLAGRRRPADRLAAA